MGSSPLAARAVTLLTQGIEDGVIPCAALHVAMHGNPLLNWQSGHAAIHPVPVPVQPDTRFDMASLTKLMATTMVALRLLADGRLTLSDTLADWFEAPAQTAGITIGHLLTHTSGLAPHAPLWQLCAGREEVLAFLLSQEPIAPPGTEVSYSCLGYIVLGHLLEKAGGAPLDVLADTLVFAPLGMSSTGFLPISPNAARQREAGMFASTEYCADSETWLTGIVHDENARFLGGVSGNAGLFSTLSDCARFAAMVAGHGVLEGNTFLSPALFDLGIRNATPGLTESRGLGFSLFDGRPLSCGDLFHIGSCGHTGFTGTSLWVDMQTGLSVVLLTNSVHLGRDRDAFFRLRRLVHNVLAGG